MRVISREGTAENPIAGGGQALPGAGIVVNLAPGPGPEFIGIYKAEPAGHIGHFCLGVQNFDADATLKTLKDRGIKARMRTRGESKEIFLTDPDNVSGAAHRRDLLRRFRSSRRRLQALSDARPPDVEGAVPGLGTGLAPCRRTQWRLRGDSRRQLTAPSVGDRRASASHQCV